MRNLISLKKQQKKSTNSISSQSYNVGIAINILATRNICLDIELTNLEVIDVNPEKITNNIVIFYILFLFYILSMTKGTWTLTFK